MTNAGLSRPMATGSGGPSHERRQHPTRAYSRGNRTTERALDRIPATGRMSLLRLTRVGGALALLVVGGVHLEQYTVAYFSVIPTIGSLFLVNFIAATVIGLTLLVPVGRNAGPIRFVFESLIALAGIGVSLGALTALLISEHTPLFGFMEHGYRREIVIALVAEGTATLLLGAFVVCAARQRQRLMSGEVMPTAAKAHGARRASRA
jgi:hypothetical protein